MNIEGQKLLKLLFNSGENICLSLDHFACHSISLESAFSDEVILVSNNLRVPTKKVHSDDLVTVAINPISGPRSDINCTSLRNMLLECDDLSIEDQTKYIRDLKIPYSALIYSGGKSIHVLIALSSPIPNIKIYKKIYRWIMNIATWFDDQCGTPSRNTRIPGVIRPDTGKKQELIEIKNRIDIKDLMRWLNKYPECKPKERKIVPNISSDLDLKFLPKWAEILLSEGLNPNESRNRQWFSLAHLFRRLGFDENNTINILSKYFVEEPDFKEKEWLYTIGNVFKYKG